MLITNKHNLPEAILRAARSDKYSRGNADISVTQLIDAPQVRHLRHKYKDKLEFDVSDRLWAMLGTAVHGLLEESRTHVVTEERLYASCGGWVISGGVDVQHGDIIEDYKLTSVWAAQQEKPEWERQLNCYAWLRRKAKGLPTNGLHIWAILRDWSRSDSLRGSSYPQCPMVKIDIPLWPDTAQDAYVLGRVMLHQRASPPPCTREERWAEESKWAAMKKDGKKAKKLFDTEADAKLYIVDNPALIIEERHGKPKRCIGNYCGVAKFCTQYSQSMGASRESEEATTGSAG